MEIDKIITLSTAHITKETYNLLENHPSEVCTALYRKNRYGWFIYVPDELDNISVPKDLNKLFEFARRHDCVWLCLDCDGNKVDFLPVYDW